MDLPPAQLLLRWLDSRFRELGLAVFRRWPRSQDKSTEGGAQAAEAVLDLVMAARFKFNPLDTPADVRHRFLLATMDQQAQAVCDLGGMTTLMIQRLKEHLESASCVKSEVLAGLVALGLSSAADPDPQQSDQDPDRYRDPTFRSW